MTEMQYGIDFVVYQPNGKGASDMKRCVHVNENGEVCGKRFKSRNTKLDTAGGNRLCPRHARARGVRLLNIKRIALKQASLFFRKWNRPGRKVWFICPDCHKFMSKDCYCSICKTRWPRLAEWSGESLNPRVYNYIMRRYFGTPTLLEHQKSDFPESEDAQAARTFFPLKTLLGLSFGR